MTIQPSPGYIFAIPYIQKGPFKSVREVEGLDQFSEVLAVGAHVMDDNGNMRTAPCKVGDIIIHAYSNKEFEIAFNKHRMVHFTEVHGVTKDAE